MNDQILNLKAQTKVIATHPPQYSFYYEGANALDYVSEQTSIIQLSPEEESEFSRALSVGIIKQLYQQGLITDEQQAYLLKLQIK